MARTKDTPAARLRRITIRMPEVLHDALLRRRDETSQSLNDLLIEAAARLVGMPIPQIQKGIPGRKPGRSGKEVKKPSAK